MRRLLAGALAGTIIAAPDIDATPAPAKPVACRSTFTRAMFIRAIRTTYAGTRTPRHGTYGRLWRYARCGRPGPHGYRLRWARQAWGIEMAHWESRRYESQFTGYVISGSTSTFGPPSDGSGTTADGGTDDRACIALRSDATLDHYFLVTIGGHSAREIQCDWGPAEWTGVAIDVTGAGDEALGLPPGNYYGTARELR